MQRRLLQAAVAMFLLAAPATLQMDPVSASPNATIDVARRLGTDIPSAETPQGGGGTVIEIPVLPVAPKGPKFPKLPWGV